MSSGAGSVLESFLDGELYEVGKCSQLAVQLSDIIKARTKDLPLPRYKLVVSVVVGQNTGQGVNCVSRSLWNHGQNTTRNVRCVSWCLWNDMASTASAGPSGTPSPTTSRRRRIAVLRCSPLPLYSPCTLSNGDGWFLRVVRIVT